MKLNPKLDQVNIYIPARKRRREREGIKKVIKKHGQEKKNTSKLRKLKEESKKQ